MFVVSESVEFENESAGMWNFDLYDAVQTMKKGC